MKILLLLLLLVLQSSNSLADNADMNMTPKNGMIKVAVVVSENANLMDFAGPWEVFGATMLADNTMPYELYTVAPTKALLHTSSSNRPGLAVTPDYSFADAPIPDIVILGAQRGGPGLSDWLKNIHAEHKIIMSVCTGAYRLAESGLLDGKQATTHHWYFGSFAEKFPDVKLVRQVRYVQSDPIIFTAGGLSSGIDLALHLVSDRFGPEQAQKTADYLEYQGTGWKTNLGISELTTPVKHQIWSGKLGTGDELIMHVIITGASTSFNTDIPAQNLANIPTTVHEDGDNVQIVFAIPGHPATFNGHSAPGATDAHGVFEQDGKSTPLILSQQSAAAN